jgi:hypothetical protein
MSDAIARVRRDIGATSLPSRLGGMDHSGTAMEAVPRRAPPARRPVPLVTRLLGHVREALACFLARPVKRLGDGVASDPETLSQVLRRGDVLLTEGITRLALLVRCLTGSSWTHVSMYVGPLDDGPSPRCIVEADVAGGVRAVPLSEFSGQRVRVLRATRLHETDQSRLADWVVSRIGDEYDMAHAWSLAKALLRLPGMPVRSSPHGAAPPGGGRYICSSLLAHAFLLIGCPIAPTAIHGTGGAQADFRYVIPHDFEKASVLEVVS